MNRIGVVLALVGFLLVVPSAASACGYDRCPDTNLSDGSASVGYSGVGVTGLVAQQPSDAVDYIWRLRHLCVLSDEREGACSSMDFRQCPQQPGRVIQYLVVQQRPVVRADGTAVVEVVPGLAPGTPVGTWEDVRQGCIDITPLNPPPSGDEVFSYFQRLPLPTLTTQHQPPGNGLAGLPVIFYTDSPTTQTFTVDIRGFTVVIQATAEQFTWHTGDPSGQIVTTHPGQPYPNQTIEHDYRSGTYTAHLTVTWSATFTVNGSAPADVPGTTTTDGPPVTFDVLQARSVLTNPYD
ncbi:hypothetical protein [Blastococcus sp. TF02A-35]|uniref:hypothetical protein n=1 Tax=Blastococcus sp. TF02A-35 TaxID=2559612 RepID=UPI001073369B|nr:hypothetical protein [Blastococcus sp. TF02A_35]TFV47795.1 hypothetical protein E4P43_14780 [Blastococcus sp. TF02A_35]